MDNHTNARFFEADFSGARFHGVNFSNVTISDAWLFNVDISGLVGNLSVSGVDISAFVEAELIRTITTDELNEHVRAPNGGTCAVSSCLHLVFRDEWWYTTSTRNRETRDSCRGLVGTTDITASQRHP